MATEAGPPPAQDLDSPTHGRASDKQNDDADTCRICRGEGTAEEPLFFPCKCSGSIKYVHQECLMEWLSHSQKKYCELCKTSFRFTKLYHPGMPSRIPTAVFVRRAAIHVLKMTIAYFRGLLVAAVWLVLLPYSMRIVWRSLFWVGDGGWSRERHAHPTESGPEPSSSQSWDLDTVRTAIASAKAANSTLSLPLPSVLMPFSQTLNMSAGEPTVWILIKRFFFGLSYPLSDFPSLSEYNITTNLNGTYNQLGLRNPSLLSGIPSLRWFDSQAANRFVIDVLEGQIITLVVVVAFILIFLIREWVVQQQPLMQVAQVGANPEPHRPHHEAADDSDGEGDDEDDHPGQDVEAAVADDVEGRDRSGHLQLMADTPTRDAPVEIRDIEQRMDSEDKKKIIFSMLLESKDVPRDLREAMHHGTSEDVARIMERMPLEESMELSKTLTAIKERIEGKGPSSTGGEASNAGEEEPNAPSSPPSHPGFPERSSSLSQNSSLAPDASGGPVLVNPLQRPNMPSRDRSFIATEIRRSMEEAEGWSSSSRHDHGSTHPTRRRKVPDSWEDESGALLAQTRQETTNSDQEHGSDHSSESWQQISDQTDNDTPDIEGQDTSPNHKGKEKAADSSSVGSHDGQDTPPSDGDQESISAEDSRADAASSESSRLANPTPHPTPDGSDAGGLDVPEDPEPELVRQNAPVRRTLVDIIMDWLFADVAPIGQGAEAAPGNDEHIVQDLADEPPFVPFAANEPRDAANLPIQDPEVAAAAAQAGIDLNDQDAIDDAEDIEGIMELIGMQGPLTGLFQNAMFSAVLISATLACAVWFPYLWGKVVLLFMGSPISLFIKLPLQLIAAFADLVVDFAICIGAGSIFWATQFLYSVVRILSMGTLTKFTERLIPLISDPAKSIIENAMDRIGNLLIDSSGLPHPDYFRLSVNSHVALRTIQNTTTYAFNQTGDAIAVLYGNVIAESPTVTVLRILRCLPIALHTLFLSVSKQFTALGLWIWNAKSYKITLDLDIGHNVTSTYTALEHWSPSDRFIAVFAGYAFFALAGALYLKRGAPFTSSQQGRKIEGIVAEILQQAGGVLKVILIISIEMLAFPLYCGLLLDVALLPLFKNASLYSRWQFARGSPWTSGFVHWFIGTCYMFHFALFVSMCRKIMRKGVLYFIRDPDDPTFHPVRDVLERSVTTQLRKIAFSALVYGGLVIVCLGGVVWGLNRATSGVLPINWSSQAPSLEFPLDLLFYNFLTPLIIRFYKPSDGLHAAYQWWFKACARYLRLSDFLFGEKAKDQEGRHDRGTNVYFMFDGRYVRAPASDQVRIPKGERVFIDVDQFNHRKDGESNDLRSVHNTDMVTMVYIPPWFRIRVAFFVFTIWVFAAMTGIGITIIPLLFGRYLFSLTLPPSVEMNDIHAFSLGIYTLGSLSYCLYHLYKYISTLARPIPSPLSTLVSVAATASHFSLRILRFVYVWTALIFIVPFLFALVLELYFLMPLHAYLGPTEPHVVHIIQDWTLGFLYARLAARIIFADRASRPAIAFRALLRDGFLNPNARLATRCFLVPVLAGFALAICVPGAVAWVLNRMVLGEAPEVVRAMVWRFCFPMVGFVGAVAWAGREGVGMVRRWRMVVRDEVYLIGERLHNFGDRKGGVVP
ncbi:hypothetical protein K491DRAFT_589394 [Lophiostoma macrostomum CBS 122681]|uniref:RING-type E3 ubiquitin transferase n=1 Tax=Lophiostoma macrostomum CBS 122681 TaxID=1314788 RepID=A0A6A6TKE2_9PLEO|nr:hypothetical protein K491DRAFT_589394 [Lophiostoma macrostomum CBS 122681]